MTTAQWWTACVAFGSAVGIGAAWGAPAAAQEPVFVARLSVVPITVAMQAQVAGRGSASGVLIGNTLTIEGTFDGLRSPATVARLHQAAPGLRGPAIGDLTVTHATRGTLSGTVSLDDAERDALARRSLYIQIHSEKAPEGNLWGWLLPQEVKR